MHNFISEKNIEIEKIMIVNQRLIRQRDLLLPRLMS